MLDLVKTALRITTDKFNTEIQQYIDAAFADLGIAGIKDPDTTAKPEDGSTDALIKMAVITYCRLHFGAPDDYARLERSYNEQKAQLQTATGYTTWVVNEEG